MSSGHTSRGRNNSNGNGNGNKSPKSRHASGRQRSTQGQPVGQHRAQIAPVPAPIRISEISAVAREDGFIYEERSDAQPDIPFSEPLETDVKMEGEPAAPTGHAAERAISVNSIRAPFAPGQNHVHQAHQPRGSGQVPVAGAPGRLDATPSWPDVQTRPVIGEANDLWRPRPPDTPGRVSDGFSRAGDPVLWSHEPQGGYEPAARDVRGDIGPLIDSLHDLFERDRGVASRTDAARCGICYLHFTLVELHYREDEGFYVCASCAQALAHTRLMMLRRQQHL